MDQQKLTEVLRATIDPNRRQEAEQHLEQIHKIIGFAPTLLSLIMNNSLDMPVRQAGAIYMKNMVCHYWETKQSIPNEPLAFHIHEQDRGMIRDAIVDAVVMAPELIRVQLSVCIQEIVKHDFPGRWTTIVDKVSIYLQSPEPNGWLGALMCMHQLVKHFEYKEHKQREALNEALRLLLPLSYERIVGLLPDQSEQSVLIQKQILKIFLSYIEYFLCLDIITNEVFHQWMEVVKQVHERPVPQDTETIDEEDRPELAWWKCKKWAVRIITRVFERYGSPGKVEKKYSTFADHFLKNYAEPLTESMLRILDKKQKKIYVSPRVMQQVLNYLKNGICHAISWKVLKPHIIGIIQEVIFPMMCYTDDDEELWHSDPYEYIRMKFDIFSEYVSPVYAAQNLIHMISKKRKDMLQKIMILVKQVLTNPQSNPRQVDGALHIVGSVADLLLKKEIFKNQMEMMLVAHVVPLFQSPHPYLRARACWMVQYFSGTAFQEDANLFAVTERTVQCITTNQDLPVKVEAAIALKELIKHQDKTDNILQPNIQAIAFELLKILRESETDDLTTVMETIVNKYSEHLTPLAVEMTQHLAATFDQLLNSEDNSEDKVVTAIGILSTLEAIISAFEEHSEILTHVENIIGAILTTIFEKSLMEFYDEAFELMCSLTYEKISPLMWKMFEMMYQVFQSSAFDYFLEMMPALHNFVTVDPQAFLSSEKNLLAVFNMCKAILNGKPGEDPECHAAKLLEVTLIQYKGQIDSCVPSFVELALERLTRPIETSELRTMCLQVVVAAIYYNPVMLFELLEKMRVPNSNETMTAHFIKQWIHDTDCFTGLHDRKLCVLGLCELLSSNRHQAISECSQQIIPSIILLFDGLKAAYTEKAQQDGEGGFRPYESDEDDPGLATDEDDLGEEDADYLKRLAAKAKVNSPFPILSATIKNGGDDDDDDNFDLYDDDDDEDEGAMEMYTTPLDDDNCTVDEYIIFKQTLQRIQSSDPAWYNAVTQHLNEDQRKSLNEIFTLSDLRRASAESRQIEMSGGYQFQNKSVPTSFNFMSP